MAATNEPDSEPTQPWDGASGEMPRSPISDSGLEGLLGANAPVTRGGWQPPSPEELQARLPHYEVTELLGRGGMGAVYKGWQKSLERFVAIKILPPGLESGEIDFAARFKREAKAMAKLKHPGIIPVHDAGETADGLLYFVMDFVEGTDVQKLLASRGKLPPEEALPIASRVLDALAYAHQRGIIHRDIKPANIMLDTEGNVLVADFGLARSTAPDSTMLTVSHMAMGTPDFMAPESHLGMEHVDHRADLYAVGVMLYQMLTGKLPRGRFEPLSRAVPGLDKRLDLIVDRTLQNERDARYSSAIELKSAIEPVLTRTIARRRPTSTSRAAPSKKPLLLGAVLVGACAVGGWLLWDRLDEKSRHSSRSLTTSPTVPVVPGNSLPEAEAMKLAGVSTSASPRGSTPSDNAVWAPLPAAVEARAIRLWDAPEKLVKAKGISWEDQALRLDQAAAWHDQDESRDAILRVAVRANPGTAAVIALRSVSGNPDLLRASLDAGKQTLALRTTTAGILLGEWPLPRAYAPTEWLHLELRAISDVFSVYADGKLIGKASSNALQRPGRAMLYAGNRGYFREVTYYPLDGLPQTEALKLMGVDAEKPSASTPAYRFPDGPPGFVKELNGHKGEVMGGRGVAILPDNRRMFTHAGRDAAGTDINEAILWDVETGQPLWRRQLLDIKGVIGGFAVLPAVNQVAVIHRGSELVLEFLDLDSGRTIRQATVEQPATGIFATYLTPSPDGRRFMVLLYPAKEETGEPLLFQLWDAEAPTPMAKWDVDEKGCAVHAAAWLDESRYVVNAHQPKSDSRFHLVLDVNQPGKVRRVVAGNDAAEFSFAPVPGQPDRILAHLRSGGLGFYDLTTSAISRGFSAPSVQRQLIFLDSRRVLGLSTEWGDALRLWDTTSGRLLWEMEDERLGDALAVSPDGRFAVTNTFVKNASGQNRPGTKLLVWRLPK